MSFLDPAFLFSFLPITLVAFAIAGRLQGSAGACGVLILASVIFCVPYGWPFVALVITERSGESLRIHCARAAIESRARAPAMANLRGRTASSISGCCSYSNTV